LWGAVEGMSDEKPLDLTGLFDAFNSALRLLGTANATGAIAVGAGFQVFEKVAGAQTYIKVVVLIFLFGVLAFTFSYVGLFSARMEFDRYLAQKDKRACRMGGDIQIIKGSSADTFGSKKEMGRSVTIGLGLHNLLCCGFGRGNAVCCSTTR
jgi:hypothetical protein